MRNTADRVLLELCACAYYIKRLCNQSCEETGDGAASESARGGGAAIDVSPPGAFERVIEHQEQPRIPVHESHIQQPNVSMGGYGASRASVGAQPRMSPLAPSALCTERSACTHSVTQYVTCSLGNAGVSPV